MPQTISRRDYVQIHEAAELLGVSQQTLRNWDKSGKLAARRHPLNGYRLYHVGDLHAVLNQIAVPDADREGPPMSEDQLSLFQGMEITAEPAVQPKSVSYEEDLPPCHWGLSIALDPKHRPQRWTRPSSTVRRDWRKFPQEAHVLDERERKYRRFTPNEIAVIQGFEAGVVELEGLTDRQRIAAVGDAVPPPLGRAIASAIDACWTWENKTALEYCAGIGGLAEGVAAVGLEHLLLIDHDPVCGRLLASGRPWLEERVIVGDARTFSYEAFRSKVGLLSGGPPCQPWSQSGRRRGAADERDLLGQLPEVVAQIAPEVFAFENVPGLASGENAPYLEDLVARLRRPDSEHRYGVMVGVFNAANYGVPQVRRRLFIVGFRDRPASDVSRCFDVAAELATHQDPRIRREGMRVPWRSIGEALEGMRDPGGWRRWILS